MVLDSSTVITPSLPTLSKASASSSPICGSRLDTVATAAMSSLESTSRAALSRASPTASAALSIPRLSAIGLAPAATARRPSWTMAWASTVAVVVPSPAMSLVLVATSLVSWAPRFSNGSSSSTSRATVTPSLVMVGAPHFLSRTTYRPLGPSVTLTVLARASTPRSRERRALSSNSRIFGIEESLPFVGSRSRETTPPQGPGLAAGPPGAESGVRGAGRQRAGVSRRRRGRRGRRG